MVASAGTVGRGVGVGLAPGSLGTSSLGAGSLGASPLGAGSLGASPLGAGSLGVAALGEPTGGATDCGAWVGVPPPWQAAITRIATMLRLNEDNHAGRRFMLL
ncbi:MAG: hypothetical protein M3452_01745, partial [Chloroflexota bacterium]|nr:hypothetical protein [Chloroflexota bacterium]